MLVSPVATVLRRPLALLVALLAALALLPLAGPLVGTADADIIRTPATDGRVPTVRYAGANRFETAGDIARDAFAGARTAVVARADQFPDALAGNYLAGQVGGPVLLVRSDRVESETGRALADVGVGEVILLGGRAAISDAVQSELARTYSVTRVGGANRYATAAQIATRSGATVGVLGGQRTALLANGENFPDALVAGGLAYGEDFPLLLTRAGDLPSETRAALQSLQIRQVLVTGGTGVVSASVVSALQGMGITVRRLSGGTRTATAVAVAEFATSQLGWPQTATALARGNAFADALAIGPKAGKDRAPLLLAAQPGALSAETEAHLTGLQCRLRRLDIAGGFAAVSQAAEQRARQLATRAGVCAVELTPETATNQLPVDPQHQVRATVVDQLGTGFTAETFTVRFEVYRQAGAVETTTARTLVETETVATTPQTATATFSYTYRDLRSANDLILACVVPATGTQSCLADGQTTPAVDDRGRVTNLRPNQLADVARKRWQSVGPL